MNRREKLDMLPCVSVITVCYNAGALLEKTIKSVLEQTYPNVQYIIIDGDSKDNTLEIVEKYRNRISVVVSESDNGIYDAMNKGLQYVKGEWVNYMNAGDTFHDNFVIDDIFRGDSLVKGDLRHLRVIGGHTNNVSSKRSWIHYAESPDVIPYRLPFSHQACFVRQPFSFDLEYKVSADYKILYDMYYLYGAESICVVNRIIADYMQDGSFSVSNYRLSKKEYLKIQSKHISLNWLKNAVRFMFLRR